MVLREDAGNYFETIRNSPYMLLVDQIRGENRKEVSVDRRTTSLKEWVNQERSDIPAVTHVDYSARVQTVDKDRAPRMYAILSEFKAISGCSVIVNTSFNVRSEPIVCTPEDAYVCFMRTGIDVLVLENFVLQKTDQPSWPADDDWQNDFMMD
jgi:carbamoyltransferase